MSRGDVVLVDWEFSDRTRKQAAAGARRSGGFPQPDHRRHDSCANSETKHGIPGIEVELDPSKETLSGLKQLCYARGANILTMDPVFIDQTIGMLSDAAMRQIEGCLQKVLELP